MILLYSLAKCIKLGVMKTAAVPLSVYYLICGEGSVGGRGKIRGWIGLFSWIICVEIALYLVFV